MARQDASYRAPPRLPVSIGATTPNPGIVGVRIWSTVVEAALVWDGLMWSLPDAGLPRELPYGGTNALVDKIHAADYGARAMLEFDAAEFNGTNVPYVLQPAEFSVRSRTYIAQPNSATPLNYGFPGATVTAGLGTTITTRAPAATSLFAGSTRIALLSAATTGSIAAWRGNLPYFYQGSDLNFGGGWFMAVRCGWSAMATGARVFIGMSATAAPGNVEPNTLVNSFGIGCLAADTNLKVISCGATAPADVVDTGLAKSVVNTWYDIVLSAPPGAGRLGWAIRRGGFGATWIKGTVSTGKMPATNTMLSPSVFSTNGTVATAIALELSHVYVETDF